MENITLNDTHFIWEIDLEGNWEMLKCAFKQESKNRFALQEFDNADPRTSLWLTLWVAVFLKESLQKMIESGRLKILETAETDLVRWKLNDSNSYYLLKRKYTFKSGNINLVKWSLA